jgi:hypothetical protein
MPRKTDRYFIYRNLRTKTWSKRSTKGIVVDHPTELWLLGATFHVSETVRQRVVRLKRKEVHAGVRGEVTHSPSTLQGELVEVTYNPYHYSTFVRVDDLSPVSSADLVFMDDKMKVWSVNPRK